MNQLNYLKGITELLVNNNFDASFFYFSQVISSSDEKDLFAILANMGLGIAYEQKKSYSFAETYYVAAITNVDNRASKELELNKVYFNAAKFYSEIKNYQKAIDLCNKGIKINKQYQSTVLLDFLLYEVAYNTKELNDPTYLTKYDRAYQISSFNENNHVKDTIKIDLKEEFKLLSSSHE